MGTGNSKTAGRTASPNVQRVTVVALSSMQHACRQEPLLNQTSETGEVATKNEGGARQRVEGGSVQTQHSKSHRARSALCEVMEVRLVEDKLTLEHWL